MKLKEQFDRTYKLMPFISPSSKGNDQSYAALMANLISRHTVTYSHFASDTKMLQELIQDVINGAIDLDKQSRELEDFIITMKSFLTDAQPLLGEALKCYRKARCITQERMADLVNEYYGTAICNKQLIDRAEKGNISNIKLFTYIQDNLLLQDQSFALRIYRHAYNIGEILAKNNEELKKEDKINPYELFCCKNTSELYRLIDRSVKNFSTMDQEKISESLHFLELMEQDISIGPNIIAFLDAASPQNPDASDSPRHFNARVLMHTNRLFCSNEAAIFLTLIVETFVNEVSKIKISKQKFLQEHSETFYDYLDLFDDQSRNFIEENIKLMGICEIKGNPIGAVLEAEKEEIQRALTKVQQENEGITFLDEEGRILQDATVKKRILKAIKKDPPIARAISSINQSICFYMELANSFPIMERIGKQVQDLSSGNATTSLLAKDKLFATNIKEGMEQLKKRPLEFYQKSNYIHFLLCATQNFWMVPDESSLKRLVGQLESNDILWVLKYKGQNIGEACDAVIKGLSLLYKRREAPLELLEAFDDDSYTVPTLMILVQKHLFDLMENISSNNIENVLKTKELFAVHHLTE